MLRYYPSFRIKANLAAVDDLVDEYGEPYNGTYYEAYDGQFYKGPNPALGTNELLMRAQYYYTAPAFDIEPQITDGNEFLLDGFPYTGEYYQDPFGNYYTYPGGGGGGTGGSGGSGSAGSGSSGSGSYQTGSYGSGSYGSGSSSNNGGIPNNIVIVDYLGNRYVFDPSQTPIPIEDIIRSKDGPRPAPVPRLLQPIADIGKTGIINRKSQVEPTYSAGQTYIYNVRVNPTFFGAPLSYHPKPTDADYVKGFFVRYFVKKINENGYIMEISNQEYTNIKNGSTTYDVSFYQIEKTFWKLTGPLQTVRLAQYDIREGIIPTNRRLIENMEKTFVGIRTFIGGEYDKFSRPTK